MMNFGYYAPTKVVFGRGTENEVGSLARSNGAKKVLVHFGGQSARASGLLDRVCASLKASGIDYVELGGVQPNPLLSLVEEGIRFCKDEGVDFILAVGGGSVIDSAKAIAYGIKNAAPVWDIFTRKAEPKDAAPVGVVLTIAAAGSEMSMSSVITNDATKQKRGYSNDLVRPRFAIMNPELTATLSEWQTMSGAVDIIMHTFERWFTGKDFENSFLVDSLAGAIVRTVVKYAPVLLTDPKNYEARAEIMWASSLSHNGLTGQYDDGDWSSHQIEHELSGAFDVSHGAGLAAVWGTWARYVYDANPARFAKIGNEMLGIEYSAEQSEKDRALEAIDKIEAFFASLNMPVRISGLGLQLTDAQCEMLGDNCSWHGQRTVGKVKPLARADLIEIYKRAR